MKGQTAFCCSNISQPLMKPVTLTQMFYVTIHDKQYSNQIRFFSYPVISKYYTWCMHDANAFPQIFVWADRIIFIGICLHDTAAGKINTIGFGIRMQVSIRQILLSVLQVCLANWGSDINLKFKSSHTYTDLFHDRFLLCFFVCFVLF